MNTYTLSQTRSFTITEARYIGSKIISDLHLLNAHYGRPSIIDANSYGEEVAQLVAKKYLAYVEYGFKKDGKVIFSLKYTAKADGTLSTDDRPGRIPATLDLEGTTFYTWLDYTDAYYSLSAEDKQKFKATLPVQRTTGTSPVFGTNGYWEKSVSYSKNGEGVEREVFKQYG